MVRRRFGLTDLGIVNALGAGKAVIAEAIAAGRSGIDPAGARLIDGVAVPFARFRGALPPPPKALSAFASRNFDLALLAVEQIRPGVEAARARYGAHRIGIVAGSSTGGFDEAEQAYLHFVETGAWPADYDFSRQEIGALSEGLARHFALAGPAYTISTACSSSAKAFGAAARLIGADICDAVIVGGADSLCRMTVNGFHAISALSATGCRPFSAARDGTVLGDGAAFFLMERDSAPVVYAGMGETNDAYNMTAPQPEGAGAARAMRAALADSGLTAAEIGYINLHGTGTALNDAMESKALCAVFAEPVPASSAKGQIGHTLAAAGASEIALCWLALAGWMGLAPHVMGGPPDPDLACDWLIGTGVPAGSVRWMMSNSYAFGGSNASVVIGRGE